MFFATRSLKIRDDDLNFRTTSKLLTTTSIQGLKKALFESAELSLHIDFSRKSSGFLATKVKVLRSVLSHVFCTKKVLSGFEASSQPVGLCRRAKVTFPNITWQMKRWMDGWADYLRRCRMTLLVNKKVERERGKGRCVGRRRTETLA